MSLKKEFSGSKCLKVWSTQGNKGFIANSFYRYMTEPLDVLITIEILLSFTTFEVASTPTSEETSLNVKNLKRSST